MTPNDSYSFVGSPQFTCWLPEAKEIHVSVTFSWDIEEGYRLLDEWKQYYPEVKIGGFAVDGEGEEFTPGMYIKDGITITSRGCNNRCPWCLVNNNLRLLDIKPGWIIQDNNLLQCPRSHIDNVFSMMKSQGRAITLSGGLQPNLIDDYIVDQLQSIPIKALFLAADTKEAIKPLYIASEKLKALGRDKIRCYVLIGYKGETIKQAEDRLERVWEAGCLPFAQLYQPPDKYIEYPYAWTKLNWRWSRPAVMKAMHKGD